MSRTYNCYLNDSKGRPVFKAWCRAYNVTDPANMVLVETQYTDETGKAAFVALPDDAPVDVLCLWGRGNQTRYGNVFSADGDDIDTAVDASHTQNTDDYALGVEVVAGYPGSPVEGEMVIL